MHAFIRKKSVKIAASAAGVLAVLAAAFFLAPGAGRQTPAPVVTAGESTGAAVHGLERETAAPQPTDAAPSGEEATGVETSAQTGESQRSADSSASLLSWPTAVSSSSRTAAHGGSAAKATASATAANTTTTRTTASARYVYTNTPKTSTTTTTRSSASSNTTATTATTRTTAGQTAATKKTYTATLAVRCDTILNNMGKLKSGKAAYVPASGAIMAAKTVTFTEGETVFDVLRRETRTAGIQMEFSNNPMYNSAYIEGIGNLYEFDCGELSGWMYRVNGWFPNYGCSQYKLQQGDVIEWLYTCDLGSDIGGGYAAGTQ